MQPGGASDKFASTNRNLPYVTIHDHVAIRGSCNKISITAAILVTPMIGPQV